MLVGSAFPTRTAVRSTIRHVSRTQLNRAHPAAPRPSSDPHRAGRPTAAEPAAPHTGGVPASPTVTISPTSPAGPASGDHTTEPDTATPATELDSGSPSQPDVLEGEARVNTHALALSGDDAEVSPLTEPDWSPFSEPEATPGAPASP